MKIFAETARCLLREILPTDIDGMFELDSDPEVHTYLGNKPVTDRAQIIRIIEHVRQQYSDHGIGRWAIIDKKTGKFMGWSGLKFVTSLTNHHQHYYDLGYRLIRTYWGQGIATETARISLDYAFTRLQLDEVFAAAHCENIGSNKILQKIGLHQVNTFFYEDIRCNWYTIDKDDYEKMKNAMRP
jgi:[ribosomal protein S5]-alanine N-acetyltransferase